MCISEVKNTRKRSSKNPHRQRKCPVSGCNGNVIDLERHYLSCHNGVIEREEWHTLRRNQKLLLLKQRRDVKLPRKLRNGLTIWEQKKRKQPDSFNLVCPICGRRQVYLKVHLQKYHNDEMDQEDTNILIEEARSYTEDMPKALDDMIVRYHHALLTSQKSKTEANNMSTTLKKLLTYLGATQDIGYLLLAIQHMCESDAKKITRKDQFKVLFNGNELSGIKLILSCLHFLKSDELELPQDLIIDAYRKYVTHMKYIKSAVNMSRVNNVHPKISINVIKRKKKLHTILSSQ